MTSLGRLLSGAMAVLAFTEAISAQPASLPNDANPVRSPRRIACSMVPVYIFTRNVVGNTPGMEVELLLSPTAGCPHHYALTPADIARLCQADIVILNGLGLDSFLAERLGRLNRQPVLIEAGTAARPVPARLREKDKLDEDEETHGPATAPSVPTSQTAPDSKESSSEYAEHSQRGQNPHVWTSIANAQLMTRKIAAELGTADPAHAVNYQANARAYNARLEELKKEATLATKHFKTRRVLPMHDVLDSFCAELGLQVVGVVQEHSGESPSAARLKQIIEKVNGIKKDGTVVILSEPQYPDQACKLIARETGQPVVVIDPLASSASTNLPAEEYEKVYRSNLKKLTEALGR